MRFTRVTCGQERAGAWSRRVFGMVSERVRRRGRARRLLPFYNDHMPISARNKLRGKIEEIQLGDVMAHVVVRVGDNLIESVITRRSADELKLKKGDTVSAVVKATEVMIQKD
jgi:molybdopterin-binding protein